MVHMLEEYDENGDRILPRVFWDGTEIEAETSVPGVPLRTIVRSGETWVVLPNLTR